MITGPTGHGKTSTLAALVDLLNAGTTHHVITLQFHERGMALSMSYEEALELADAMQKVVVHIGRGRQRNGG